MTVESALYPPQLNTAWPQASDMVSEGDNHIRLTKTVIKTTFPNVAGAVSATDVQLSYVAGVTSAIQAQIDSKGAIAGQTWTGAHVFPSTTTIGGLTPTIRGYLETVTSDAQAQLNASALKAGDTYTGAHNFSGASSVALPANTTLGSLSPTELGYVDGVTAPIQGQLDGKADITGESYSGTHDFSVATIKAPTLATGTNTTDVATTAFVNSTGLSSALPGQTGNADKFVKTDGTSATWAFPVLRNVQVTGTSHTAAAGTRPCLENVAASTITLPPSPANNDVVGWRCDNLRVDNVINRNGNLINGLAENMTLDNAYINGALQFRTGYGWSLIQ